MIETAYIDDLQIHGATDADLLEFHGLGSPEPRNQIRNKGQRHGVVNQTQFYGPRVIELKGGVWGPGLAMWQKFDAIRGKLQLGATRTLRFRREGFGEDEQVTAIVSTKVFDDSNGGRVIWTVALVADDPRIFATTLKAGSYDPSDALSGGGITLPMTFPLVFSTTTVTHLQLVNAGSAPSPPVLTIHGPVVNPIIDNDTLGESIYVVYSLGESDVVVVDVATRRLTLNGAARRDLIDARQTSWFEIAPGTNLLRLRGSGMANDITSLTCQYRDARI